jgi:predicted pyridoxine 5'-phosphate oxidase superfamily flavin-nucleotide-binding protein
MRFNGKGMFGPERGIFLMVEQVYGNCPKYIQARRPAPAEAPASAARPPQRFRRLTDRHRRWIAGADTFFIASFHPEGGADASHRGGSPGFVRTLSDRTLVFPDYPGNNMFNTLGNITACPLAGLLFVDFERGDLLQLTGRASLVWDQETVAGHPGAQDAVVAFEVDEAVETPGGTGLRWELVESAGRVPVTVPPGSASQ